MKNNQVLEPNRESVFIGATEVAEIMEISRAYAYRIIKELNNELEEMGKLVLNGKTNRKYFYEKINVNVA